ncbi:MAG: hypothetical protein M1826_002651 [Phylliscum demangeonii]|nr:MAG: hypothetical protein M1826_002651 [Phylliscum demangeonii]
MTETTAAQAALLEWVNDFALASAVSSMEELSDGTVMWRLLQDLDAKYFTGDLPSSNLMDRDYWLPKWQNLKKIYKDVTSYLKQKRTRSLPRDDAYSPDLKTIAVAKNHASVETTKLLKVILLAAIHSPNANKYLSRMSALSVPAQAAIRAIIEEMALLSQKQPSSPANTIHDFASHEPVSTTQPDAELLLEEQLAKLLSANKTLDRERGELQEKVTKLTDRMGGLEQDLEALHAKGGHNMDDNRKIQELKTRVSQEQEDVIGRQEITITKCQSEMDALKQQVENLRVSSMKAQQLQDTCDELKAERETLIRKANTVDRYKQKLEANQKVEKEAQELRSQLEDSRQQTQRAEEHSRGMELTIEKFRQTLENVEQQNYELHTMKRQLELDNNALRQRYERVKEQNVHNTQLVSDLQDRVSELEGSATPVHGASNLNTQLNGSEQSSPSANGDETYGDGQAVMLQKLLDDAKSKNERLERMYLETQGKNVVLEYELQSLSEEEATPPGSVAFLELRKSLQQANKELSVARSKLSELEASLSSTKGELSAATTDLKLVNQDQLAALHELQRTEFPELQILRDERARLQSQTRQMQAELDQHQSLLNKTLLDKDSVQKSLLAEKDHVQAAERSSRDYQLKLEKLDAAMEGRQAGVQSVMEDRVQQLQEKVGDSRGELATHAQHIKKQNQTIQELQDQLRQAVERHDNIMRTAKEPDISRDKELGEREAELANVLRENACMATAWYNLNRCLQMNNVELQRRAADEPRSWIKKQRLQVKDATVGVARGPPS